jgi:hypothetical protein
VFADLLPSEGNDDGTCAAACDGCWAIIDPASFAGTVNHKIIKIERGLLTQWFEEFMVPSGCLESG